MNGGNVLVANTVNMTVSDPIIELGSNNIGANDLGIIMTRPAANSNVALVYDESADILRMGYTLNGANDSIVDLDSNALAVSVQGALSAGSNLEVGTANLFVDTSTSRVGIGMSNPSHKLDVAGDINFTGSLLQNGSAFQGSKWSTSGSDIYRSSGNVGIGTTNPGYTLDVNGTAGLPIIARTTHSKELSENFYFVSGSSGTNSELLLEINTNSSADTDQSEYAGTIDLHIVAQRTQSNYNVDCYNGQLHFVAGWNEQNDFWQILEFNQEIKAVKIDGYKVLTSIPTFRYKYTDRKLQIYIQYNYEMIGARHTFVAKVSGDNVNDITSSAGGSIMASGTDVECVKGVSYDTGGNVGIGTTNPVGKLDVLDGASNGTNIQQNAFFYLRNPANAATNYGAALVFENTDGAAGNRKGLGRVAALRENNAANYSSYLQFSPTVNGSEFEAMRITSAGNVGIGTASPNGNLHIMSDLANASSQINPSAQLVLHSSLAGLDDDGDIGASLVFTQRWLDSSPNSHGTMGSIHGFKDLSAGNYGGGLLFKTQPGSDTAPVERMRIDRDGNVGIGTASPLTNLDINGDLRCPSLEAQYTLSGGGDVTWTGTYVKWSTRVIALPVDPNYAASGHYNINCPTSGTITYYANSGDTTKTCTSSGIPLGDWDSLYYVITKGELSGSGSAPINGNFIAVQYTNTNIKPQTNWLFICGRNSDNSSLKWMPGQQNLAIGTTLSSSGGYTYKQYTLDEAAGKSLSGAANNESITIAKKGLAFVSFSALIRASATNGTAGVGTTACYASLRKNSTAVTEYIGYRWATYGYTNDTDRWRALNLTWSGPVDTGDVINFYVNTAENTIGTNGSHFSVLVI
jgi:hypothetical protein